MRKLLTASRLIIAVFMPFAVVACGTALKWCEGEKLSVTPLDYLPVLFGDYFTQLSRETGRLYHIYVRLPLDYVRSSPNTRYPVVYLLDGDSLFPILATEHLFLTNDENLPEAIIVGISYGSLDPSINKRGVDFTSPTNGMKSAKAGAPAFQSYMKTELIPLIENKFRADPERRILFGQSLGGSFVLYSAFSNPDLFWGRIASNPSFGPDGARYFGSAPKAIHHNLGLVVTSGTRDQPRLREEALKWFHAWDGVTNAPWSIKTINIEYGTHAADSANSYRAGMLWLFRRGDIAH